MSFHKPSSATLEKHRQRRASESHLRRYQVDARILQAYDAEPDREYAEAVWGSMLRERGIHPDERGQSPRPEPRSGEES